MTKDIDDSEDFALRAVFGRAVPPVPDAGFSTTVTRRLRRQVWKRRVILLSATTIGLVIALPTAAQLLNSASGALAALVANAEQSDALGQFQVLLQLFPLRETVQAASEELRTVTSQLNSVSWLRQNSMLVFAGLMAAAGLVTTRLLDR